MNTAYACSGLVLRVASSSAMTQHPERRSWGEKPAPVGNEGVVRCGCISPKLDTFPIVVPLSHCRSPAHARGRKLVLLFDGTWNDTRSDTNVYRMYSLLEKRGVHQQEQLAYYSSGVGTKPLERYLGGIFGRHLSRDLLEGYQWLRRHYRDGDDIFVFGFSRGAFTAMGLVGFLAWCGLLQRCAPTSITTTFEHYRKGSRSRQEKAEAAFRAFINDKAKPPTHKQQGYLPINTLKALSEQCPGSLSEPIRLLVENSVQIRIRFLGVWDTVRSTSLDFIRHPWWQESRFGRRFTLCLRYTRHLPPIIDEAYHALAIDEHRPTFPERLWILPAPESPGGAGTCPGRVEQRWFPGAHSNVGGGYPDDRLAFLSLQWMHKKASEAGLRFDPMFPRLRDPPKHFYLGAVTDSFWKSWGTRLPHLRRYRRKMHALRVGDDNSAKTPYLTAQRTFHPTVAYLPTRHTTQRFLNETIDPGVVDKIKHCREYRPGNLLENLENLDHDLTMQELVDGKPTDIPADTRKTSPGHQELAEARRLLRADSAGCLRKLARRGRQLAFELLRKISRKPEPPPQCCLPGMAPSGVGPRPAAPESP